MIPKLLAFDLDGTLLNSKKELTSPVIRALEQMNETGAIVAFASGRLGSSMRQYAPLLNIDLPMLTLNGAAVYMGSKHQFKQVYDAPLAKEIADYLLGYSQGKDWLLNYYAGDKLYAVRNDHTSKWIDLYFEQTSTQYNFIDSYSVFSGKSPSKIIFVGSPETLDYQEEYFRKLWGDAVYVCRTWDYYLEFLNPAANKGMGLEALAHAYGLTLDQVAAFGDANNDIPMLQKAGLSVAMKNASEEVKKHCTRVSVCSNDEDGVAKEWDIIKAGSMSAQVSSPNE